MAIEDCTGAEVTFAAILAAHECGDFDAVEAAQKGGSAWNDYVADYIGHYTYKYFTLAPLTTSESADLRSLVLEQAELLPHNRVGAGKTRARQADGEHGHRERNIPRKIHATANAITQDDIGVAAVKSALAAGNSDCDSFTKVVKQATDPAEANATAAITSVLKRAGIKKAAEACFKETLAASTAPLLSAAPTATSAHQKPRAQSRGLVGRA